MRARLRSWRDAQQEPAVLIATPVKDAAGSLDDYFKLLDGLTYPRERVSLGFLESDSVDGTFAVLEARLARLRRQYRRVGLWKRDFGYRPPRAVHVRDPAIQPERRSVLAKSRNHLVSRALVDEDWVLWIDVDIVDSPPNVIERLLATGEDIVQPNCVLVPGGPTFDHNGWCDRGRLHLDDLRGQGELVRLDAVGGTMLLVRADLHREGLVFPVAPYGLRSELAREGRGEVETEGLGIMAHDMGYTCWGMPDLEIFHRYPY
jgi:hypothetical protein